MFNYFYANLDSATSWQLGFQDPATPIMEGIINLHHDLMFFITFIFFFVGVVMFRTLTFFSNPLLKKQSDVDKFVVHGTTIEIIWTVIPSLILIVVALPSFALLYSIDEIIDPTLTLKCVGNQWFWSYEFSDFEKFKTVQFDSYLVPESDLQLGNLRLLEVDNRVLLPVCTHIRLLITSTDVLHSWTVPSIGVKLDASPGRLNQTNVFLLRSGFFTGACSEICGSNHALMPIGLEAVSFNKFILWLSNQV